MKNTCYKLPKPKGTKKLDERAITRYESGVFTVEYSLSSDCDVIFDYYKKILSERDWKMLPRGYWSPPEYLQFRKDELDISVLCRGTTDLWGGKYFSVSCSKGLRPLIEF